MKKKSPGKPPCGPGTTGPCRPKPPKAKAELNLQMADAVFGIFGLRRVSKPPKTKTK